jgi:hypothetical protein
MHAERSNSENNAAPKDWPEDIEKCWSDEILRIDDVRSSKVEMIAGEQIRRKLSHRLRNRRFRLGLLR